MGIAGLVGGCASPKTDAAPPDTTPSTDLETDVDTPPANPTDSATDTAVPAVFPGRSMAMRLLVTYEPDPSLAWRILEVPDSEESCAMSFVGQGRLASSELGVVTYAGEFTAHATACAPVVPSSDFPQLTTFSLADDIYVPSSDVVFHTFVFPTTLDYAETWVAHEDASNGFLTARPLQNQQHGVRFAGPQSFSVDDGVLTYTRSEPHDEYGVFPYTHTITFEAYFADGQTPPTIEPFPLP